MTTSDIAHTPTDQLGSRESFSTLLRQPTAVVARLQEGEVHLERRGAEDLVLARESQYRQRVETLDHVSRLVASAMDDATTDRMAGQLGDEYPWLELLPAPQRREFVVEYFRLLRATAHLQSLDALSDFLIAWEGTAEAYGLGLEPTEIDDELVRSGEADVPDPRT